MSDQKDQPNTSGTEPKRGRPPGSGDTYTEAIADCVCEALEEGITLSEACRRRGMPARRTVYDWIDKKPNFAAQLERARQIGADAIAEQALTIANTPQIGEEREWDEGGDKVRIKTGDMLGHRKLQIETRLKLLACWHPKRYGDQSNINVSGSLDIGTAIAAARSRLKKA